MLRINYPKTIPILSTTCVPGTTQMHDSLPYRCFETALQLQPENIGVLLGYGESVMSLLGGNYNFLRHATTLFKRCLASKDFANSSKMVHHRIFHNLVNALGNPWNYYQN